MPYIRKEKRSSADKVTDPVIEYLQSLPMEEQDGTLNYIFTKIVKRVYPKKYFHLNRALGVLTAVTHEFYRRVVATFEDGMIRERGDVE